ncbi:hypothetical protein [Pseudozobellia thermophila]|uniref:CHRD domain-containing protein n=1 Tax=Pseudozobellia thermophila TaxID=192903 RepID=A0A1M6HV79_9FLAO|nr:hypothetical protein [Pseudozobellia thermophila]SHJ26083.1 hypothetical protein SAMN04488513_103196 [Pseudozobellia thermophila]
MEKHITNILLVALISVGLLSCEQERLEPILTTAEGGGTLTQYIAYSVESTDPGGANVNGRVVFWKNNLDQTLVQIALYNTIEGEMHPAVILSGPVGDETTTMMELDDVSGDTGEFGSSKFFVISDTAFYDSILEMDAHINIYLGPSDNTIVATGGLGTNAEAVESN